MKTYELIIQGMHCNHCVMAVRRELAKLPNIQVQDVQIGKARVTYDEGAVRKEELARAVEEAGYTLAE